MTSTSRFLPLLAPVAVAAAVATHLLVQAGMFLGRPGAGLSEIRSYFPYDQLGYLTIVENVSRGTSSAVEPLTETGSNYYPHLYYSALGLISRMTGWTAPFTWNVVGLAVQGALVAALSVALILVTRRWWWGLVAPSPFVIGTFAFTQGGDAWFTTMRSHAVLWGVFGTLHTLNGEVASLGTAIVALAAIAVLVTVRVPTPARWAGVIAAALVLGVLAAVQTYSFLTALYLIAAVAAAWIIARERAVIVGLLSLALIVVLFLAGPVLGPRLGQLATLVLGLLPAVPGLVLALVRSRGRIALVGLAAAAGAAPQVVLTVSGIVRGDPFLLYRVGSNIGLGVETRDGIVSALPLLVPLAVLVVAGAARGIPLYTGYGIGATGAWFLVSTNDRWGANAEPYRLWIDGFVLIAATLPLVVACGLHPTPGSLAAARRPGALRIPLAVLAIGSVIVAAVSSVDFVRFATDQQYHEVIRVTDARYTAAAELAALVPQEPGSPLIEVDTCLDPDLVKIRSGAPLAWFHLGMAWPRRHEAVQRVMDERVAGRFVTADARAADVGWLLTDSSCSVHLADGASGVLTSVASRAYGSRPGQRVVLWRLGGAGATG